MILGKLVHVIIIYTIRFVRATHLVGCGKAAQKPLGWPIKICVSRAVRAPFEGSRVLLMG